MAGVRMSRQGIWLLAAAALLAGGCAAGGRGQTLAQVGKQAISVGDLNQALANLPGQYQPLLATSRGKHQILDNLVKKSLLVQEAERRGIASDPAVKSKLKDMTAKARAALQEQLTSAQQRLASVNRDVYENVLLSELNARLKQDQGQQANVSDEDIQAYYEEYRQKLKALNPAAKPPTLETVAAQIRSVLVEERLLKDLEKKDKVSVREDLFQKLYGEKGEDVTIQDNTGAAR